MATTTDIPTTPETAVQEVRFNDVPKEDWASDAGYWDYLNAVWEGSNSLVLTLASWKIYG